MASDSIMESIRNNNKADDNEEEEENETNIEDEFPLLSEEQYGGKEESNYYEIPIKLKSCLSYINADVTKSSPILGREKETEAIMKVLLKNKKRNCILVGKPGVGKTAIMEHLAWKIAKGECVEELKGKKILMLDVNGIVAGTIYRGILFVF
ncbi:MAG: ATP-dependent Clp protease ATP-binding subunit [Clostridia bacterium]|nr:ATP-dependent Clp protease ATP-binding subunit [Clostridia bacterium]